MEYNFYTIIFNSSRQNSKKYIHKDKQAIEVYLQLGSLVYVINGASFLIEIYIYLRKHHSEARGGRLCLVYTFEDFCEPNKIVPLRIPI